MKAALYEDFRGPISLVDVDEPEPPPGGVVLEVRATGICRSDWHGWMGHDPDIRLPHVPGHEMAGVIVDVGPGIDRAMVGERVTLPFVCGCGACPQCASGNQQVCDRQSQPGFTRWGSFAEYVAVDYAAGNLVPLPDDVDFASAAALGCRFATSYRAVVDQGRVAPGDWVAVHGCGGVGLAAVMIAAAYDARVVAVDVRAESLDLAGKCGASVGIDASAEADVAAAILDATEGGANISIDALGSATTFTNSVACLAKRGRHIQVGLMTGDDASCPVPLSSVIARELELLGSHGMQAHRYPEMLELIRQGRLNLGSLGVRRFSLGSAATILGDEELRLAPGVSVITEFRR
jgi:alcohol dehydrogenase